MSVRALQASTIYTPRRPADDSSDSRPVGLFLWADILFASDGEG